MLCQIFAVTVLDRKGAYDTENKCAWRKVDKGQYVSSEQRPSESCVYAASKSAKRYKVRKISITAPIWVV